MPAKTNKRSPIILRLINRVQGRLAAVLFVLVFALLGTSVIIATHAATPGSNEPPQGLIIQVSSLSPSVSPATFKTWLDSIRRDHRNPTTGGYINSVVLQDIGDQNGTLLTSYLDVIKPYLPGGITPAFDRAYIGTVDLPWTASGSKYIEGIENAAFRTQNVNLSVTLAKAFKARYPTVRADWYITYEANLAGFWDSNIESSYLAYMNQLMPALSAVTSNKAFLWSPSFWTTYNNEPSWALPGLKTNLADLFSKVRPSLTLDLQDFVGQSNGTTKKEDAAQWIGYLKTNYLTYLPGLEINTEQFIQQASGSIVAGDPIEVPARENYYVQQSIKLGPAWEIRYWHHRLYGS